MKRIETINVFVEPSEELNGNGKENWPHSAEDLDPTQRKLIQDILHIYKNARNQKEILELFEILATQYGSLAHLDAAQSKDNDSYSDLIGKLADKAVQDSRNVTRYIRSHGGGPLHPINCIVGHTDLLEETYSRKPEASPHDAMEIVWKKIINRVKPTTIDGQIVPTRSRTITASPR